MEEDELPISHASVAKVIKTYRNRRLLAINDHEWEFLRRVTQTKK